MKIKFLIISLMCLISNLSFADKLFTTHNLVVDVTKNEAFKEPSYLNRGVKVSVSVADDSSYCELRVENKVGEEINCKALNSGKAILMRSEQSVSLFKLITGDDLNDLRTGNFVTNFRTLDKRSELDESELSFDSIQYHTSNMAESYHLYFYLAE